MKILEKEIEFNFFDADISDKIAEQSKILGKSIGKIGETSNPRNVVIRTTCNEIINFFNKIIGEENTKEVFGNKTDWNLCFKALDDFFDAKEEAEKEQVKELNKRVKKYERYLK